MNCRQILKWARDFSIFLTIAVVPIILLRWEGLLPSANKEPAIYHLFFRLPYILFVLIAFLGLKLNQTRVFFTSLLLGMSFIFLAKMPFVSRFAYTSLDIGLVMALAVPISASILFSFGEGPLFGVKSLLRMVIIIVPTWLMLFALKHDVSFFRRILQFRLFNDLPNWYLPGISLFLFIGCIEVIILIRDRSLFYFSLAFLISFLPLFYAFNSMSSPATGGSSLRTNVALNYSAVGLVLLYAIYKLYWQKAYIDELTGVPNRRALDELMRTLGRRYAIAMADIDFFKNFNDEYGHAEGDNVLRFVAKYMYGAAGSYAFRYGGEEFTIVFNGANTRDVFARMEKLRKEIAQKDFYIRLPKEIREKYDKSHRGKPPKSEEKVHITISVGVASRTKNVRTPEEVIAAADKFLYQAKHKGRNCVVSSEGAVLSM